jgi:chromosome segregation ATPase
MVLLNIFQNSDGGFAWDNIVILIAAFILGYLIQRFSRKQSENRFYSKSIQEWENKYKKLENEFKTFKSNLSSADKQAEKNTVELSQRVKSLEGDIRALSDEKNKYHHQLISKAEELKTYSRQVSDLEDSLKSLQESKLRSENEWGQKHAASQEALHKASAWEGRVRAAEEEALKARAALNLAERRKLEAELRLKSTTEYAGKVVPLEKDLATAKEKLHASESDLLAAKKEILHKDELLQVLQRNGQSQETLHTRIRSLEAQLELLKDNNTILQQEFELKHANNLSLKSEIETLRQALTVRKEEVILNSPIEEDKVKEPTAMTGGVNNG